MVRTGLLHDLQQALTEARESQAAVRKEDLHVSFEGHGRDVNLVVTPIVVPNDPTHYLIVFEATGQARDVPAAPPAPVADRGGSGAAHVSRELDHTRRELEATRRYLQPAIQDLEIVNEELQSANEEVLSSNEELQSTNEELDTAKEELQSTNEELNTLNAELHSRNDELSRLNSDLINLLSNVQLAVIMVDRELRIHRFTPPAEKLFNLIATDIGRPIHHLKPNLVCPDLEQTIQEVIERVAPVEQEAPDTNGHWYLLSVRPYCSIENRIEGAVIAVVDIDAVKRRELETEESHRQTMAILQVLNEGLVVLDSKLRVRMVNETFCRMFGMDEHEAVGQAIADLGDGDWREPRVRALLTAALSDEQPPADVEIERELKGAGKKNLILNARRIESRDDHPPLVLLAIRQL